MSASPVTPEPELRLAVEGLMRAQGLPVPTAWELLRGGNNRVYRLEAPEPVGVAKQYFMHPSDPRDRFAAERSFFRFAHEAGIQCIPDWLGCDEGQRVALFQWVEGDRPVAGSLSPAWVRQAAEFVVRLNRDRNRPGAALLPAASEACFSLAAHLATVERRLERLGQIAVADDVDRAGERFVRGELQPAWIAIRETLERGADRAGIRLEDELAVGARCISPSDFGFHNVLSRATGELWFVDFEYAGWDDPAKLVCDFFCQPQVPVPLEYWDEFVQAVGGACDGSARLPERAALLLPVIQVKWCCILLNEFVPRDRARREFARGSEDLAQRKAAQLSKAREALGRAQHDPPRIDLGRLPASR